MSFFSFQTYILVQEANNKCFRVKLSTKMEYFIETRKYEYNMCIPSDNDAQNFPV